jgi:hypothetical protein
MSTVRLEVSSLPSRVTTAQVEKAFSALGRVYSVKLSGDSCTIEMEGAAIQRAIDSSGIGEITLGDLLKIDSSGIGELEKVTISLAGNSRR